MPTYEDVIDDAELPWSLEFRSCAEQVARWSRFDDEPLTGLPDLHDAERNQAERSRKNIPRGATHLTLLFRIQGLCTKLPRGRTSPETHANHSGFGERPLLARASMSP